MQRPPATGCSPPPGSSRRRPSTTSWTPSPRARAPTASSRSRGSLVGPVNETHDLLYDSALSIVAEAILPIRHCLVGPQAIPIEDVREIRSHAVALDQCRRLLSSMPWATAVVAPTTGDAAAAVANRRPLRRRDCQWTRGSDALSRRDQRRRRRPRGVHALRRARAVHAPRPTPRRVANSADLRDAPPPGGSTGRSSRWPVARSTWCSSSRAPSLPAVRLSLRLCARRASARRRGRRRARRDAGRDRTPARVRLLQGGSRRGVGDGRGLIGATRPRPRSRCACSSAGRYWSHASGTRWSARLMKSTGEGARGGRGGAGASPPAAGLPCGGCTGCTP